MYVIESKSEVTLIGRPRREDQTIRSNFKLNVGIRHAIKVESDTHNRSESAQIERFVIEAYTLKRILQKYPELAAELLPKFNEELPSVANELRDLSDVKQND